jgi:hypothetical protein
LQGGSLADEPFQQAIRIDAKSRSWHGVEDVKFSIAQLPGVRIVGGNAVLTNSRQAVGPLFLGIVTFGIVTAIRACGLAGSSVANGMKKISYIGYRFPPEIIQQAIWLYLRFTLSFRDVEDLLAERGIAVSYETIRRWVNHFGPMIAADLRKRRPKPHTIWHLDEGAPRRREGGAMS